MSWFRKKTDQEIVIPLLPVTYPLSRITLAVYFLGSLFFVYVEFIMIGKEDAKTLTIMFGFASIALFGITLALYAYLSGSAHIYPK